MLRPFPLGWTGRVPGDDGSALAKDRDPSDRDIDRRLVQDKSKRLSAPLSRSLVLARLDVLGLYADNYRLCVEDHELIAL